MRLSSGLLALAVAFLPLSLAETTCKALGNALTASLKSNGAASAPPKLYRECLRQLRPLNTADATEIMKNAKSLIQWNTLNGASKKAEWRALFGLSAFDIYQSLNKAEEMIQYPDTYSDFEFWDTLATAFEQFKDFHVVFNIGCARTATYQHDYPIVAIEDPPGSGNLQIWTVRYSGNDVSLVRQISTINGEDPLQYLQRLLRRVPEAIDPDTRWNLLMAQFSVSKELGFFASRSDWDENEDEKLTLRFSDRPNQDHKVLWKVKVDDWDGSLNPNDFKPLEIGNHLCYKKHRTLPTIQPSSTEPDTYPQFLPETLNEHQHVIIAADSDSDSKHSRGAPARPIKNLWHDANQGPFKNTEIYRYTSNSTRCQGTLFFVLSRAAPSSKIGVLTVATFDHDGVVNPSDVSDCVTEYEEAINDHLKKALATSSLEKLIVDVSSNSGGRRYFAGLLFNFLFEKQYWVGEGTYAARKCHQAVKDLYKNANYTEWRAGEMYELYDINKKPFVDGAALINGCEKDLDGEWWLPPLWPVESQDDVDFKFKPPHFRFPPSNIALVSNGYCGSACSRFVNLFRQPGLDIKTYAYGGRYNTAGMQPAGASQGEMVTEMKDIAELATKYLSNPKERENYPLYKMSAKLGSSSARVNSENDFYRYQSHLNVTKDIPLQYKYRPVKKFYLQKNMVGNQQEVWKQVARLAWNVNVAEEIVDGDES